MLLVNFVLPFANTLILSLKCLEQELSFNVLHNYAVKQ